MRTVMTEKVRRRKKRAAGDVTAVRASISFPPDVYEAIESIAREKKVSLAWVVRDASEKYIAENKSLLVKTRRQKEI